MSSKQQHAELNVGNGPLDAAYIRLQNVNRFQVDSSECSWKHLANLDISPSGKIKECMNCIKEIHIHWYTHIFSKQTQWSDGNLYQQMKSVVIPQEPGMSTWYCTYFWKAFQHTEAWWCICATENLIIIVFMPAGAKPLPEPIIN